MMNIVILDGHTLNPGDNPWTPVERLGKVTLYDRPPLNKIIERARDAEVILTNKVPLDADTLAKLPALKLICVTATGYNIVDTRAASARGIVVTNVPEYSTDSVAQFTFAMILELCHGVGYHDYSVKAGEWEKCPDFSYTLSPTIELTGKTLGIIGFGRIGRRVGSLAHAFGMEVLAASRSVITPPGYSPFAAVPFDALLERSDFVTLHCPLTEQNKGMINRSTLSRMKSTACLINLARGGLVNEQDLADALKNRTIAAAAVDVVSVEPITSDNPLPAQENCIITPHIAWATVEARQRLMSAVAKNIEAYLAGRPVNVVN